MISTFMPTERTRQPELLQLAARSYAAVGRDSWPSISRGVDWDGVIWP